MGLAKKVRKFAEVKRIIGKRDARLKENKEKADLANKKKKEAEAGEVIREMSVPHRSPPNQSPWQCGQVLPIAPRLQTPLPTT